MSRQDIAREGLLDVTPGFTHMRHAGEVIHGGRPGLGDRAVDRLAIVHLDIDPPDAAAANKRLRAWAEPGDDVD